MKKKKLLWIPLVVILCAVICGFLFWDTLAIYVAPQTVLADAVSGAMDQLQERFADDPIRIVCRGLDPEGKQTVHMDAESEDTLLGQMYYDMQFQVQPHRIYGEGMAFNGKKEMDLSVYLDSQFMAVSSENLLQGSYYGIQYDSFLQDIKTIPLLYWMLGEATLSKWDASVKNIQEKLLRDVSYSVPQIPNITEAEKSALLLGLRAVPAKAKKATIEINGQPLDCYRITYSFSGEALLKLLRQFAPMLDGDSASVHAECYLWEKNLVSVNLTLTAGEETFRFSGQLGQNIRTDPLDFTVSKDDGKNTSTLSAEVRTSQEASKYQESWNIRKNEEESIRLAYLWDSTTGQMKLSLDDREPVSFSLTPTEDGFRIDAEDFLTLYRGLLEDGDENPHSRQLRGSITVSKGAEFSAPAYKKIDQWSLDDFLVLLEGFGGLLGIDLSLIH